MFIFPFQFSTHSPIAITKVRSWSILKLRFNLGKCWKFTIFFFLGKFQYTQLRVSIAGLSYTWNFLKLWCRIIGSFNHYGVLNIKNIQRQEEARDPELRKRLDLLRQAKERRGQKAKQAELAGEEGVQKAKLGLEEKYSSSFFRDQFVTSG